MTPARVPYTIGQLRRLCLSLPEVTERPFGGHVTPCFRVHEKIFVFVGATSTISLKVPPGVNEILIGDDPQQFFLPPYVGSKGWVGVRLRHVSNRGEIDELIRESYRLIAPRRLAALLDEPVSLERRRHPAR